MLEQINPAAIDLDDLDLDEFPGYAGRRRKAAMTLTALWSGTTILHLMTWGHWIVVALTVLLSVHALRLLITSPLPGPQPLPSLADASDAFLDAQRWPYVSILVAAKNEEAVIQPLVQTLCALDYPQHRYDLWVVDDNSCDRTPILLDQLTRQYDQLHVIHRTSEATGGKSGALNQVLPHTQGDVVAVFDADAKVPMDLLRRVIPLFQRPQVGAVQVRKAVTNGTTNLWTQGQQAEMALDSYYQQQRIAVGGLGELRGNGQFVRRSALEHCGGWNEATITDDLDLTFRLHMNGWDIDFLLHPAVREEGVTRVLALWHQRNRWAEGGYQRYLDYWRLMSPTRLGLRKSLDLFAFWVIQYALPSVALPDLLLSISRHRLPIFMPVSSMVVFLSIAGMVFGLRRTQSAPYLPALFQAIRGTLYMIHWVLVVASTTVRLSVRPKRLKWIKTVHLGLEDDATLDVSSQNL
ncbi:Beta-monoglucosyldiacylglycerol synthase [Halomicronema hongdechloris C2206]|uniref:Beta-monoglucosyldiacylglycerol synthase n=1 Tax=Halomicronema hongdechloris C2206 TaxID=1641165 RepID=A0A1Z3HHH6_9CYAN|nr:glycosyltransferase family 2 protein [Halomicronema hongdechloris]ASC69718.1 Beta-monoglucosyldiacylglycerol synthase [Halomicronema hongdechloris C2206]